MNRRRALALLVLVTGICVGGAAAADASSPPPLPTDKVVCADVIYTNGQTDQICVNF